MANKIGTRTLNNVLHIEVDGNPAVSPGLSAPVGSTAYGPTGGTWKKVDTGDTDWVYLETPIQNQILVKKNPVSGEFDDIQDAIDSITDASESNRYKINVGPGIYSKIVLKPYVWVYGAGQDLTIIESDGDHAVVGEDNSGIVGCLITGASDEDKAGVYYASLTGTTNTAFWVIDCRIGSNDYLAIADGAEAATALFFENVKIGGMYSFAHGFFAQNSGRIVFRSSTTTGLTAPYPDYVFKAVGAGSQIVINGAQVRSGTITGGACIHLADGALLRATGLNVRMFSKAIWIENDGAASSVDTVGILLEGNTVDIQVDHPGADGTFNGSANHNKIIVHPDSLFSVVLSCNNPVNDGIGSVTVGSILQGDRYDRLANLSLLSRKTSTLGQTDGGVLSDGGGLDLDISAGYGFLNDPTDFYIKEIHWDADTVAIPANSVRYVYVDTNGTIQTSGSLPSFETVIPLGKVSTNASGIRYIENTNLPMSQYSNKIEKFMRSVLQSMFVDGCIISESLSDDRKLTNSSGSYFYGVNQLFVDSESEFEFEAIYSDGSSGYTTVTGQDTVSNTQYDDGSGTLANLSNDYYATHYVYVLGDSGNQKWFLRYSTSEYETLSLARDAARVLPNVPDYIGGAVVRVASIIVQQGTDNVIEIVDIRPRAGGVTPSSSGATFHDDLLNRNSDDNHPQYLLISGTRAMTGNLDMGGQNVTNVNLVDGVDVSAHASRHLPNGADPLTTGAPTTSLTSTTTNSEGTSNSFARAGHTHAITTGTPVTQNADQTNAAGDSEALAKANHVHNIPTATPVSIGAANAQGNADTFSKSNHVHQGVHSLSVDSGTDRFDDLNLTSGHGIKLTDDGAGNFEVALNEVVTTVNTTNAAVTPCGTLAIPNNTIAFLDVIILGRRTGGSAGATGDSASYLRRATYKNVGGTVTVYGVTTEYTFEDQGTWDVTFDVTGTSARVNVIGAVNNNITWTTHIRWKIG